jgi:CheY-like chemotaxis protein
MRVLLAEDHPTNRKVVELLLEPLGVTLVTAVDGAKALEAFRSAPFDLVLMDMQMPVMDGLTATREIRAWERQVGRQPTPLVMLTANTQSQHREAAAEAGADGFLPKPVTPQALYAILGGVEQQSS